MSSDNTHDINPVILATRAIKSADTAQPAPDLCRQFEHALGQETSGITLSEFRARYIPSHHPNNFLLNAGPSEIDIIPDHSPYYSAHGIFAQWAIALTILPDILDIDLQEVFESLSFQDRVAIFMIFAHGTPDVSFNPSALNLRLDAQVNDIEKFIDREIKYISKTGHIFEYVCDHYSCFLDACLKKWEAQTPRKDLLDAEIDTLLDMAAQANERCSTIEHFFATHSSRLSPNLEFQEYLFAQATAYFKVKDATVLDWRTNIIQKLNNISVQYSDNMDQKKYKTFLNNAKDYLQYYIDQRCEDIGIPAVRLMIGDNSDERLLAAIHLCALAPQRLEPYTNTLIIHAFDSLQSTRKINFLEDALNSIEHELLHVQSSIVLLRTNHTQYANVPDNTAKKHPPLELSAPIVQMFMPLWRNTDRDKLLMRGRYYRSTQNPDNFNYLALGLNKSDPSLKPAIVEELSHFLYVSQLEEKVANIAGNIAAFIIIKALKPSKISTQHTQLRPALG